ncbi:hypothetical protein DFH09DRAFT_1338451 [Mycena vulgaris]|nr:hypothetical protein DFH09DRAFT_1338451 [Mycena vulgaris]
MDSDTAEPSVSSDFDELDVITPPPNRPHSSRSTPVPVPSSESNSNPKDKIERRTSGFFDLGRVLKNLVTGSQDSQVPDSSDSKLQAALEAATQAQVELDFVQQKLRQAEGECIGLREQVKALRTDGQHVQPDEAVIHRLKTDAQEAQETIRRLEKEAAVSKKNSNQQSAYIEQANHKIDKLMEDNRQHVQNHEASVQTYEARVETLIFERGKATSQLKQFRNLSDGHPKSVARDAISLDPFDNKVDQVSEASVKSGVESLNESLDTFTMSLLDKVEELANRNSNSSLPAAVLQHSDGKLVNALAEHGHVEEKRGFILDASLHHGLVTMLDNLCFSGEVVSRTVDFNSITGMFLRDIAKREPWSVVQRWRALTAAAGGNLLPSSSDWAQAILTYAESIVALFAMVHRQPFEIFEPLIKTISTRLAPIFEEANRLSIMVRRDVLSVRMSVVVGPGPENNYLPYNPDVVSSVWPDMEVVAGDEVIALYKFGLKRETEKAQVHLLIKPQVTTAALLREMAKPSASY